MHGREVVTKRGRRFNSPHQFGLVTISLAQLSLNVAFLYQLDNWRAHFVRVSPLEIMAKAPSAFVWCFALALVVVCFAEPEPETWFEQQVLDFYVALEDMESMLETYWVTDTTWIM